MTDATLVHDLVDDALYWIAERGLDPEQALAIAVDRIGEGKTLAPTEEEKAAALDEIRAAVANTHRFVATGYGIDPVDGSSTAERAERARADAEWEAARDEGRWPPTDWPPTGTTEVGS